MLLDPAGHIGRGMVLLLHLVVLAFTAAGAWWLSGYDTKLTGEDRSRDRLRRGLRCGVTLVLVDVAFTGLLRWVLYRDFTSGYVYLFITVPLGITWAGCLGEVFARAFQYLVDPQDAKPADLHEDTRALDELARLVRAGRKAEAIQLCQQLRGSGRASGLALETMLSRLDADPAAVAGGRSARPKPLEEADHLRAQGRVAEAEAKLLALLKQEPANQAAGLMLMRVYTQDLRRPDRAEAVLRRIAQQRFIPPAFLEYARRSITEWSQPLTRAVEPAPAGKLPHAVSPATGTATPTPEPAAQSVADLLAQGYLGSAIELLEQQLQQRPNDFELWLKLAEAQAVHCGNLSRARKIIDQLQANPSFTPEQVQQAREKFKAWQAIPAR